MNNYDIQDDVILLNTTENNLSDTDPLNESTDLRNEFAHYKSYPTKYFLHEIFFMEKTDMKKCHTLKTYGHKEQFYLKITTVNLAHTLLAISKETYWAADYAKYLSRQLEINAAYIDWYNLVLNYKLEKGHYSDRWSFAERKKYILEYEERDIYNTVSNFKNEIILRAIMLGDLSLFDRNLQQFSKYVAYQGAGHTLGSLCANYGVSFSYRRQKIGYLMQMQS